MWMKLKPDSIYIFYLLSVGIREFQIGMVSPVLFSISVACLSKVDNWLNLWQLFFKPLFSLLSSFRSQIFLLSEGKLSLVSLNQICSMVRWKEWLCHQRPGFRFLFAKWSLPLESFTFFLCKNDSNLISGSLLVRSKGKNVCEKCFE